MMLSIDMGFAIAFFITAILCITLSIICNSMPFLVFAMIGGIGCFLAIKDFFKDKDFQERIEKSKRISKILDSIPSNDFIEKYNEIAEKGGFK